MESLYNPAIITIKCLQNSNRKFIKRAIKKLPGCIGAMEKVRADIIIMAMFDSICLANAAYIKLLTYPVGDYILV